MALTSLDLTIELREILLTERPPKLYEISPKGTVPVLHLPNGIVIDESLDILLWVYKQLSSINFDSDILQQVYIIDGDFKYWLNRYKYPDRYPQESQDYYFAQAIKILKKFEKLLDNNNFFGGLEPGFLDIATFPLIRQFAHVNLEAYQNAFTLLYEWYSKMHSNIRFNSIMEKYSPWKENSLPLLVNFHVSENTEKLIQKTP